MWSPDISGTNAEGITEVRSVILRSGHSLLPICHLSPISALPSVLSVYYDVH